MKIGLLPASGKATRVNGLPKFALPVSDDMTLLEWHFKLLSPCVDEVRIVTRSQWAPIVSAMNLKGTEIIFKEPSTMSDAINLAVRNESDLHVIGMPDTFIRESTENHYLWLSEQSQDFSLALWNCPTRLFGKVGQVRIGEDGCVTSVRDKDSLCRDPHMWGAFSFSNRKLDSDLNSPSFDFANYLQLGGKIAANVFIGQYNDLGSFAGIQRFYSELSE